MSSFHQTIKNALLSEGGHAGSEAFDEFDQFYMSNNFEALREIRKMIEDGIDADKIPEKLEMNLELSELRSKELVTFYQLHKDHLNKRLSESLVCEGRGYGGWLSPSGVETPVSGRMDHGPVAEKILGDEWEERRGQGLEAAEILGKRGYARLVHQPNQTLVDMDTNSRITSRQLSYLKNLGIENNVDIFLDVGQHGRYIYKAGE